MPTIYERRVAAQNNPNRNTAETVFDQTSEIPRQAKQPWRKYPKDAPISQRYVGYRGGKRPTCVNKGCGKELRVHQPLVCSEACGKAVFTRAMLWLKKLGVTQDQIIEYLQSDT